MNTLFTFELLVVAVLIVVVVTGAIYVAAANRRREQAPIGERGDTPAPETAPAPREFYKRLGLETGEEMKMRLYSLGEYEDELGGDTGILASSQFVAALKAYRQLDEDWYDYPPRKAADVLELTPEDYEVDDERGVLLLKRFPRGLPTSARDL